MIPEVVQVLEDIENVKIFINYVSKRKQWNRDEIVIDNVFAYKIALDIINKSEDYEPKFVEECRRKQGWSKWKDAIHAELNSLAKQEVFELIVQTPEDVKSIGCKWVFVRKRNEKNEIMRYKARLVAQDLSQRSGID